MNKVNAFFEKNNQPNLLAKRIEGNMARLENEAELIEWLDEAYAIEN